VAEAFGEGFDGQEEGGFGVCPVSVIEREATGGDDAVEVRMMGEVLSPGVKDGDEAGKGAELGRIGGEFK
jgi:hypothetical protein